MHEHHPPTGRKAPVEVVEELAAALDVMNGLFHQDLVQAWRLTRELDGVTHDAVDRNLGGDLIEHLREGIDADDGMPEGDLRQDVGGVHTGAAAEIGKDVILAKLELGDHRAGVVADEFGGVGEVVVVVGGKAAVMALQDGVHASSWLAGRRAPSSGRRRPGPG